MRKATNREVPGIMRAMVALLSKSPAPHMRYVDTGQAERGVYLAVQEDRAWFVGPYFIMVDAGSDWYSADRYLIEQIIIKVPEADGGQGGLAVDSAIAALDDIATLHGCSAIAVGDTQVGMMLPRYQDQGFRVIGHQLFKSINTQNRGR